MTTERQTEYLRDLGIDGRVDLEGIAKVEASEWIDEPEGLVKRAGLPVGRPLTSALLVRLGARSDALAQPPGRSVAPVPPNGSGSLREDPASPGRGTPPEGPPVSDRPPAPPLDESWLKAELSAGVTTPIGEGATVTVSASAHHQHGPKEEEAEALGALVRRFLEREVARFQREYVSADAGVE